MAKPEGSATQFRFDTEFLDSLKKDPKSVMLDLGVEPTPEILDAINEMDFEPLYRLAEAFPKAVMEREPTIGAEAAEVSFVFP